MGGLRSLAGARGFVTYDSFDPSYKHGIIIFRMYWVLGGQNCLFLLKHHSTGKSPMFRIRSLHLKNLRWQQEEYKATRERFLELKNNLILWQVCLCLSDGRQLLKNVVMLFQCPWVLFLKFMGLCQCLSVVTVLIFSWQQ